MEKPKSPFVMISCPRCKKKQIIFGRTSRKVKCKKCNYLLTKTTGGKTKIRAPVEEVIREQNG